MLAARITTEGVGGTGKGAERHNERGQNISFALFLERKPMYGERRGADGEG